MDTPSNEFKSDKELAFRQFLANALSLFAVACLCYVAFILGFMWLYAWQNNMYPFISQRGVHPPWSHNPILDRGFENSLKASSLAIAVSIVSGVLITNLRAVILMGCAIACWIVVIWHGLALLID